MSQPVTCYWNWSRGRTFEVAGGSGDGNVYPCYATNSTVKVATCCSLGTECRSDGFCYAPNTPPGTQGFGRSSCTDPTLQDSACNTYCTTNAFQWTTYISNTKRWACCGTDDSGNPDCSSPTSETWDAPAPEDLATLSTLPFDAPPTFSPLPSGTSGITDSSGLGVGAGVGIGIAVALGVVSLLLAGLWLLRRRRNAHDKEEPLESETFSSSPPQYRDKYHNQTSAQPPTSTYQSDTYHNAGYMSVSQPQHVAGASIIPMARHEASANRPTAEMQGSNVY